LKGRQQRNYQSTSINYYYCTSCGSRAL